MFSCWWVRCGYIFIYNFPSGNVLIIVLFVENNVSSCILGKWVMNNVFDCVCGVMEAVCRSYIVLISQYRRYFVEGEQC